MKRPRRILWIIAAASLLTCLAPASAARPASEEESAICEKAFIVCISWPGHNLPWDIFECLGGYGYCRKYIEPLLGGLPG
jgi:hypothetical protein